MSPPDIPELIRQAGVVGAGGAGFPTHVKASARAEVVIANGAECEPLLHKDKELMKHSAQKILEGLELMMAATGAPSGVVAAKAKSQDVIEVWQKTLEGRKDIRLQALGDYYPAGDEFSLVYEVTGRLIPPGGIPIQIGAVVNNVETLLHVAQAKEGPVTDTYLTLAGAVNKPCTLKLPIGTSIKEAIAQGGDTKLKEFGVLEGGAMMGRVADPSEPVTKTTGGLIVLPKDHPLLRKKGADSQRISAIGKSACDQCSFCTEFCPRYLLGYSIEPHKVMRSLAFSQGDRKVLNEWALLCCACSLCSLYACPEELDPKNVCVMAKKALAEQGVNWKKSSLAAGASAPAGKPSAGSIPAAQDLSQQAHPMLPFRKVPISRLIRKLGLWDYQAEAPLIEPGRPVETVRIPLKQHLGAPAKAAVAAGQKVKRGDIVGTIPEGQPGAQVHASIDGTVKAVDTHITIVS